MDSQEFEERSAKADAIIRLVSTGEEDSIRYPRHEQFVKERLGGSQKKSGPNALPSLADMEAAVSRAQADSERELKSLGNLQCMRF